MRPHHTERSALQVVDIGDDVCKGLGVSGFNLDAGFDATRPIATNYPLTPITPATTGRRIALHQLLLHELSLEEQIAVAQGLGVTALGLTRVAMWRFGEERAGMLLRESGLGVTSLSWAGGFTGTAGFTFREAVADGRMALREAALIGAETLIVAPGNRGGHTLRHAQRITVDGLKFLADEAAARRVRLAVKCDLFNRRPKWTCVNTVEVAAEVLDRVASDWVGLACPIPATIPQAVTKLESLADRIVLAWTSLPETGIDPTAHDRWRQRFGDVMTVLQRGGFRGEWEFRPEIVAERCTLDETNWPSVRFALDTVRSGMSATTAVESGRRPQTW